MKIMPSPPVIATLNVICVSLCEDMVEGSNLAGVGLQAGEDKNTDNGQLFPAG